MFSTLLLSKKLAACLSHISVILSAYIYAYFLQYKYNKFLTQVIIKIVISNKSGHCQFIGEKT